jgi:hypothetical protein
VSCPVFPQLSRDSKSFEVEAGFLGSQACSDLIAKGGVHVARAYAAMSQPCLRDPIEGRFALLLEDLGSGGWQTQPWLLDPSQARSVTHLLGTSITLCKFPDAGFRFI